jgi:hypothetical protein
VPFHTAPTALCGLGEDAVKEASWAAQFTVGISTYVYGTGYSQEQFVQELAQIVEHIKASHG